jgi:hypothetical protein
LWLFFSEVGEDERQGLMDSKKKLPVLVGIKFPVLNTS